MYLFDRPGVVKVSAKDERKECPCAFCLAWLWQLRPNGGRQELQKHEGSKIIFATQK